jgi:hypothetical protein
VCPEAFVAVAVKLKLTFPRTGWLNKNAPDLSAESLTEFDAAITQYFTEPEVQYIGATSRCGCEFPH